VLQASMGGMDMSAKEPGKHDYRYKDESLGTEGDSWIRAIAMAAGQPGIR
jgi:hypothetical protein